MAREPGDIVRNNKNRPLGKFSQRYVVDPPV